MIGAIDCHRQECTKMALYLSANTEGDDLVDIVKTAEKKKTYGILVYLEGTEGAGTTNDIDEEHEVELGKMKLHGDYFTQRDGAVNINVPRSEQWLERSQLRFETESLICAAQEQALATKYMTSKLLGGLE